MDNKINLNMQSSDIQYSSFNDEKENKNINGKTNKSSSEILNIGSYLSELQAHSDPVYNKIDSSAFLSSKRFSYANRIKSIYNQAIYSTSVNVGTANLSNSDKVKEQFKQEMSEAIEKASLELDKLLEELSGEEEEAKAEKENKKNKETTQKADITNKSQNNAEEQNNNKLPDIDNAKNWSV